MTNEPPSWIRAARHKWRYTGASRPDFAEEPGPGQESVWDYPRPPAVVTDHRPVEVRRGDDLIASTTGAVRVLETAGAPTFYLPPDDVDWSHLTHVPGESMCEWKGSARYWALADHPGPPVAWAYPDPFAEYAELAGWPSFYVSRLTCTVDGERVRPQPGGFYGGWLTDEIVGPIKGNPGTESW